MRYLICLGRTMIWNTVSGQCAMENDALPGDEEPLPRWWCVALCACSPLSHYNGSVFYHELWPSLIWRRGTVCGSNSPFGARHGANSCVSVKIPQPTWRRWRRSCSRQACHPRVFFTDLNVIAQKQKVLLCFENFEATRQELQQWLIHLGDYKASQHIRFVIAGRNEPGVQWSALSPITRTIRLDVLTEPEAEKFLNVYGVTNPTRRAEILESSGRLPVIMSWLAAAEGNEPDISLPTHSIVERFLRWVDDPQLRQVALVGALPLTFNVDTLKLLLDHQGKPINEQRAFDWLLTMPFVKQRSDGWYYHEVVRRMMMYYQRQRSPQSYRQRHTVLADFYNQSRQELGLSEQEYWTNRQWRKDTLAYCYHDLLTNPTKHWAEVITLFALAVRKRRTFSIELLEMLSLADVQNELSDEQARVVQLFRQQLQVIREGNLQHGFAMFDTLCQMKDLSDEARGHMLAYRGECHRLNGKFEEALNDSNEALRYLPEDVRTLARRGTTFILLQRFEEALTDLNRALALDAKDAWT